jgi:hypothetical protein
MTVKLSGDKEVPPVAKTGTGTADITYDPASRMVTWNVTFSGLDSQATMAHFHGPAPAGKIAGVKIWLSKKGGGGTMAAMTATSPLKGKATLTPAEAKQFMAGDWYVNVHTKNHPAGDIRGQVIPPKS